MTDLKPLIRFAKHQLDEKRMKLVELQRQVDALETMIANDRATLMAEQANAMRDAEAALALAGFAHAVEIRRKQARVKIAKLEKEVERAKDVVMEAFRETKRYETAQEAREAEERAKRLAKEQDMFDETALNGFRRANGGG
jgi:flagellar biosynthesis chaperone FliJ